MCNGVCNEYEYPYSSIRQALSLQRCSRGNVLILKQNSLSTKNTYVLYHIKIKLLPIKVLPVPGGPNNKRPFGGPRSPVKISLKTNKNIKISVKSKFYVIP